MLRYIVSRTANGKSRKGKSRTSSQTTLHENTSMRPARRRCFWSFPKKTEDPRRKQCVENFQCRCTARGPQQGTHRRVTPMYLATADSVWLVGTRAFSDVRSATLWCTEMTSCRPLTLRQTLSDMMEKESSQGVEQVHIRQRQWTHV